MTNMINMKYFFPVLLLLLLSGCTYDNCNVSIAEIEDAAKNGGSYVGATGVVAIVRDAKVVDRDGDVYEIKFEYGEYAINGRHVTHERNVGLIKKVKIPAETQRVEFEGPYIRTFEDLN